MNRSPRAVLKDIIALAERVVPAPYLAIGEAVRIAELRRELRSADTDLAGRDYFLGPAPGVVLDALAAFQRGAAPAARWQRLGEFALAETRDDLFDILNLETAGAARLVEGA